jgi:uncharacterized protein
MLMAVRIEQKDGTVRVPVRAQPRASRSELAEEYDGALKVRLAAPPVEGEANRELERFMSRLLGVPKSAVRVVAGQTGRSKVVEIDGASVDDVARILGIE